MFNTPVLKFIGDQEMVLPIMHKGYILGHPDYANYYYPKIIECIDAKGMYYKFKKVKVLPGVLWWQSFIHFSKMQRWEPELLETPKTLDLNLMKEKVFYFIRKTKHAPKDEQDETIELVKNCSSHLQVIEVIASVGYWN